MLWGRYISVTFSGGRSWEAKKMGGSWNETPNEEESSEDETA